MKVILPAVVFGFTAAAQATVYGPGTGGAIPDNPSATCTAPPVTSLVSTIAVADSGTVSSVNGVTVVLGNPNHTWVGDLVVILTAPNGDNCHIMARAGTTGGPPGSASDIGGTFVFTNTGASFNAVSLTNPVPPGTYARFTTIVGPPAPDPDDYTVFNGDPATGNWTLTVEDWCAADVGGLVSWSLDLTLSGGNPCPANIVNSGTSAGRVDVDDLLAVISGWGPCPAPPATCPANIATGAGSETDVDVDDLLAVIGAWGPCPVS